MGWNRTGRMPGTGSAVPRAGTRSRVRHGTAWRVRAGHTLDHGAAFGGLDQPGGFVRGQAADPGRSDSELFVLRWARACSRAVRHARASV